MVFPTIKRSLGNANESHPNSSTLQHHSDGLNCSYLTVYRGYLSARRHQKKRNRELLSRCLSTLQYYETGRVSPQE